MPTFTHGKKTYFALADTGDLTTADDISNVLNEVGWPRNADEVETTTFGAGDYKTYIGGFRDASINLSGRWTSDIDSRLDGLLGGDAAAFIFGPVGSTGGNVKYSGTARVLSYEMSNTIGDVVGFTSTLRMDTAPSRGTFS